ncbi:uncharacterized protein B0I36DRAFT_376223 [Microdochium trichocladiopsis]|uniref:Symplekin/Pta1 N-terminal domain-containing protein n=1 Tax=Microdochium trichocladiopsis TaxID=1682393 RepID=A0A9P8Y3G4_9PEZI|nr:uncharacterized protein B0I36DRAFT_376223 [Microdochium trichocladiopsis]KAH7026468.1 hypothetical protein B0I36DRAFT_376223 [Microdochium trichocladiopsis]
MASTQLSVPDQIRQLEDARKLVLGEVSYYPQVIQATLPIIGPTAKVEFRRWGTEFLCEAFASPVAPLSQKETWCIIVLETLKQLLEDPKQDIIVLRSAIQASASIYPIALRWIIGNAYDTSSWERLVAIKARIFQIWDSSPSTVRICCIKFAQRVVLAQTASIHSEPRRSDPLDISLRMVTPDHPLLDPQSLEAEAFGVLDRMLAVLQENSSDALLIDGTLNTLSVLIRARPSTSTRIINVVLNFNPLKLANSPMTPKNKVLIKSMEKTTRMLCMHLARRDPNNPLAGRIQQHVERLMRARADIFDNAGRKRMVPVPAEDGDSKRQRTANMSAEPVLNIAPLDPAVTHSLADVFALTQDTAIKSVHVPDLVAASLAARISIRTISGLDAGLLDKALNAIRERLAVLHEASPAVVNPETAKLDLDEDDDDYEPDYFAAEDTEQILNKLDSSGADEGGDRQKPIALTSLALPTFKLPPPPTLNPEQAAKVGQSSVARVFGAMRTLEDPAVKRTKAGINRLAASSYDRDSWITVLARLATRAGAGLDESTIKDDEDSKVSLPQVNISNSIRDLLYAYILEDFRKRIEAAVSWLTEEWYNDRLQQRAAASAPEPWDPPAHYDKWALRLLDGIFPYLHAQDKVLTRFLSELPELSPQILSRVKELCRDPSLVNLALTSLYYLVMMRPPVRDIALDAVEGVWNDYEDARPIAAKYLQRWRPGFLEAATQKEQAAAAAAEEGSANGTAVAA